MEYSTGSIGRVFTVRLDHGDDILSGIEELASIENIQAAVFMMLGAARKVNLVVGPRTNEVPPDPIWKHIDDAHEIIGIGNIFQEDGKPKIHLHSAAGKDDSVNLGCLRKESEVFMVVEIFIIELCRISASRVFDAEKGFAPLVFDQGKSV